MHETCTHMNQSKINFVIDALGLVLLVMLAATGFLIYFVLPAGMGHGQAVWGMTRHDWGDVHFWLAVGLLAMIGLHLAMHWRWVWFMIKGSGRHAGLRLAAAVLVLLVLLGLAVSPWVLPVESTGERGQHRNQSVSQSNHSDTDTHSLNITGSMTLRELETSTGVSAAIIWKELGLPGAPVTDERLGRLRRKHEFSMQQLRDIVAEHQQPKP